ncbi:hypothetical protein SS1G_02688 [Sclerotinia sclerotiorum 1980 UF-70]|uniref:HTH CENPB-type domain-containing protein n=1 Tax=Sclerotinia sclerotiorum (strain ATCC 18683 / 1980 / Ss-1) TaxID=665079 RepID=A7EBK2_SCLS1|nr:hypothetical protein SS1G_02688 [Sclerotinia sclerotiorum 1980 UF-70]EDN99830.1 hypothetical protein SS1G_02688 [Sclerotinia sclerotiorum 1980 UF-70]
MNSNNQEARILLAIEVIHKDKKLSIRKAAMLYNIPRTTLRHRMEGLPLRTETRANRHKITELEEEVIVQYILDMDLRGFPPKLKNVEDMANDILESRGAKRIGKLWAHRFVKRRIELKTRFSRVYDFQRALCEDPKLLEEWFRLVANMRAKYVVQGQVHLFNWYTETNLPVEWAIKPTSNGWTNNETGLEWLKHFDKHTKNRRKGKYRMLVLDRHESHESVAFQAYCKENDIICLRLPLHSSHLTQPLDVGCFSNLKRSYGGQIDGFIKAYINHISKVEFFIAFKAVYEESITSQNMKSGFRGTGLIPFNPEVVLSKLDIRIRTPTPPSFDLDQWISQTPRNPTEALSQSTLVKSRITRHQASSPTPIFETVLALAKGTERLAHENTLLNTEIRTLRTANEALNKRRRAKKTQLRQGGVLTGQEALDILSQQEIDIQIQRDEHQKEGNSNREASSNRYCSKYRKTGHNARTCQNNVIDPRLLDS